MTVIRVKGLNKPVRIVSSSEDLGNHGPTEFLAFESSLKQLSDANFVWATTLSELGGMECGRTVLLSEIDHLARERCGINTTSIKGFEADGYYLNGRILMLFECEQDAVTFRLSL